MTQLQNAQVSNWLGFEATAVECVYKMHFAEHHLGNIFIRSLHGGVTGTMIELCAEAETQNALNTKANLSIITSSIDYLRISRDADLFARASICRLSRRLSVVDVECWQDSENIIIARGTVTIKIGQ